MNIKHNLLPDAVSKQSRRPNTKIHYPLFTEHTIPMPAGPLKYNGWRKLTYGYPDTDVVHSILGICRYGARIGYEGDRETIRIHTNLISAEENTELVMADIETELKNNRLTTYPGPKNLPDHYTALPLGLTDKADGSKRRIHHLSFPANSASSINGCIPENYGAIAYSTVEEAITVIAAFGRGCQLIKRDFESAFRHIPISPIDSPLLGFRWQGKYYSERFLPFGLRTAPYLFNLFAEMFHWILVKEFMQQQQPVEILHYLDDFFLIIPHEVELNAYSQRFSQLCKEVGLVIKVVKNKQGTVASFGGVEFDTEKMAVRLPQKKLDKARSIIEAAINATSLTLLELQRITGNLNFVAIVVPLGRTFLRRMYNMQLYFPPQSQHCRRRITSEARKDLTWWLKVLSTEPERSIIKEKRSGVRVWSDASGTKGLGAFYITEQDIGFSSQPPATTVSQALQPGPGTAFSMSLPHYISKTREHINTKEMRTVEQALLHWGQKWTGRRVTLHTDNRAVAHGIANRTIRGASMDVLRRCLLLAAQYDLEMEVIWISTHDNTLADALSRFDLGKIANLAPQLIYPTSSPLNPGFLTYGRRACHK